MTGETVAAAVAEAIDEAEAQETERARIAAEAQETERARIAADCEIAETQAEAAVKIAEAAADAQSGVLQWHEEMRALRRELEAIKILIEEQAEASTLSIQELLTPLLMEEAPPPETSPPAPEAPSPSESAVGRPAENPPPKRRRPFRLI